MNLFVLNLNLNCQSKTVIIIKPVVSNMSHAIAYSANYCNIYTGEYIQKMHMRPDTEFSDHFKSNFTL